MSQSTEPATAVAATAEQAPEPLSDEEMEILVARIALYPDELVAVITASSLYPLQIIEAQRFLDDSKTKKDLKPKSTWDGSVVSLLNYPEIVAMMSDDLDWTQLLGEVIVNQQDDVLTAIQQLRERAVAQGVIKSDDKMKIVEENDNIVIQPASKEVIYVPQYEPEMLYEPTYVAQPVSYYPDPYPYYYDPIAPFFAGAVTGIIWAGIVDWDDGFWGGNWGNNWGGGDIDIDCNNCFNDRDFNGRINMNDVDWKNVDRSKIKFDKTQLNKIDRTNIKNSIKTNDRNKIKNQAGNIKGNRPTTLPGKGNAPTKDIRKDTLDGLKNKPTTRPAGKPGQGVGDKVAKPGQGAASKRPDKIDRPVGKPKPAAKADKRPNKVSPVGEMGPGKTTKKASNRGAKSMGGGMKKQPLPKARSGGGGGGGHAVKRGGGGRR
ncbi:DUF3300 domain-containing protein [Aestuariivirga sp.]|uniref:DUF3300 domain-containing protein n=1 Tax=Aestuariivirga sp. TaxID=2650926 RepID=UPI0035936E33